MSDLKNLAEDYFSRHTSQECHITSDGRVFHTEGTAVGFAAALEDNNVLSFKRGDFINEVVVDVEDLTGEQGDDQDEEDYEDDFVDHEGDVHVDKIEDVAGDDAEASAEPEPTQDIVEDGKAVELKNFDTATASYQELKGLALRHSLETISQTKLDLIAAIVAAQTNLNTQA